jgi:hypothetical protein
VKVKNCSVGIVDDSENEPVEFFYVWLTQPKGSGKIKAAVGNQVKVKVTIINQEDGMYKPPTYLILHFYVKVNLLVYLK